MRYVHITKTVDASHLESGTFARRRPRLRSSRKRTMLAAPSGGVKPDYKLFPIISVSKAEFCPPCVKFFLRFRAALKKVRVAFHFKGEADMSSVLQYST